MRGLTCRLILLGAAIGVALSISAPFVFMPATLIWRIPWLGEHAYEAILWLLSPTGNEGFLGPLFFLTGPSTLAADAIVWLVWRRRLDIEARGKPRRPRCSPSPALSFSRPQSVDVTSEGNRWRS